MKKNEDLLELTPIKKKDSFNSMETQGDQLESIYQEDEDNIQTNFNDSIDE